MKKIRFILIAVIGLMCVACDKHIEMPDLTLKTGHVLCTDGSLLPYSEYSKSKRRAIAVVFHINHNQDVQGDGYAVYLNDIYPSEFADTLGIKQGTSCSITAHDGNENTYALLNTAKAASPLAESVFAMWQYGQSAYIPSVEQMRLLYSAKSTINPILEQLGGEPLPDEADDCWYWTSTEVDGQDSHKAWLYSLGSGAMQETPKLQAHRSRPIVTLNK